MSDVGGGHRVQTAESATVTASRGDQVLPVASWRQRDDARLARETGNVGRR